MNKNSIIAEMKELVDGIFKENLPEAALNVKVIKKNNGVERTAFAVSNLIPNAEVCIYVDEYAEEIQAGRLTAKEAADRIYDSCTGSLDMGKAVSDATQNALNKDFILSNAIRCLVNYEDNASLDAPHKKFMDLMVIYKLRLDALDGYTVINNKMIQTAGISLDELEAAAAQNEDAVTWMTMGSALQSLDPQLDITDMDYGPVLIVVTNTNKMFGATAMLNKKVFREIAEYYNTDKLVILPSSIHEVLVSTCDAYSSVYEARTMVMSVNETIDKEIVLSDSVYCYDAANDEIRYLDDTDLEKKQLA